jgi:hypothetical protein
MFESLDDTMKRDENATSTKSERIVRYVAIAAASVLLFGGLFFGVHLFS